MMTKIKAILWKIGSSLVVTVPSAIIKEGVVGDTGKKIFEISVERPQTFSFLARPWKCGGSHVVTIPVAYVEVYDLMKALSNKIEYTMDMVPAKMRGSG